MKFGIWLPVYGGWLRTLDQTVEPDVAGCLAIAQQAEALNFDFLYASENLLNCIHGPAVGVIDAWCLLAGLAGTTSRIELCGAVKPGFRSPLLVARMIDTVSQIARRQVSLNIVCGWWQDEFKLASVDWLDHAQRYDRADEFLRTLNCLFDPEIDRSYFNDLLEHEAFVSVDPGNASDLQEDSSLPHSFGLGKHNRPPIWIAGHSDRAIEMTACFGDCLFVNGMHDDALAHQVSATRQAATQRGRSVQIALNAYVIATEDPEQALRRREQVLELRNEATIDYFRKIMGQSGASTWSDLSDQQMVDSNAGFDARLIGSFDQIRNRIRHLSQLGVDKLVCQFDEPMRDVGPFMKEVIRPLQEELVESQP